MKVATHTKLLEIESVISRLLDENAVPEGNVSSGTAGAVLFYYHLYNMTGKMEYSEKCEQVLADLFENYNFNRALYSHCSGQSGINWLIGYLIEKDYLDKSDYAAVADTQLFLFHKMKELLAKGFYDFLHDGIGILLSFLNAPIEPERKQHIISEALILLEQTARKTDRGGIFWPNVDFTNRVILEDECNIGIAHGIPAIAAVLAISVGHITDESLKAKVIEMLNGIGTYLLDIRAADENSLSRYPYLVNSTNTQEYQSRLAWCYGDLGLALTFWHIYEATYDSKWKDEAIIIMNKAAARKDLTINLLRDAAICHGTGGVSHIFRLFYYRTGEQQYLEAADYWLQHTLMLAKYPDGLAGFKSYSGTLGFINTVGFLEGLIGIGLVLIAALSDNKNDADWGQFWIM